jgi:hypothetical protein
MSKQLALGDDPLYFVPRDRYGRTLCAPIPIEPGDDWHAASLWSYLAVKDFERCPLGMETEWLLSEQRERLL